MTPEAFLHDIIENPEDDAPRLVFADWLEETRGFINWVRIHSAKSFREHADAVFAAAPVQELEVGSQVTRRTLPLVLASPLLARLTGLTADGAAPGRQPDLDRGRWAGCSG